MLKLKLEYPASDQASKKLKLTQKEKHMSEEIINTVTTKNGNCQIFCVNRSFS